MTEGNSKQFEMAVGSSNVLEAGMMEGENFYTSIESTDVSESASQNNWPGGKPPDTGQLCRSCANPSDYLIPIYEGEGLEHQLEYKIQKHLPIQVSSTDALPLQLCYQCASTLIAWDTMINSCLEADRKLKAMLEIKDQSKNKEIFEDSQIPADAELIDSDDEPLIASKEKLLSEKEKAAPIKKKILSKAKSKPDKTATNSKEEDRERMVYEEDTNLDDILECELKTINKVLEANVKKCSTSREKVVKIKNLSETGESSSEFDLVGLVNESDISSIIQEANLLKSVKIKMGNIGLTPYAECPLCEKVFERDFINEHLSDAHNIVSKSTEIDVMCQICDKTFTKKMFLQRHVQRVHEKVVRAKCKICDKTFTDMSNYRQHLLIHAGVKSYMCQICGKGFVQSQGLRMHMPSHSDKNPYTCKVCSKGFRRKQHYELHMVRHSGKKTHQCETCGKFFCTKNELRMHSWIHKEEWPYLCLHCHKGFNQSCGLRLHMKNHHPVDKQFYH